MDLMSADNVKQLVIQKFARLKNKKVIPFAVFDVDGTLLDPFPRQLAIYEEILAPTFHLPPIHELDIRGKPYFIPDLVPEIKKDPSKYKQVVEAFLDHFLSPEYLPLDLPFPGAIAFVESLRREGIGILYLTSRHLHGKNSMADKTIETMGDVGFPIGPSNEVIFGFKPNITDDDFEYKRKFAQKFKANKFQSCIFFVDNESKMCQIFQEEFPECFIVRFDSAQSQSVPFNGPILKSWEKGKSI